MQIRGVAEAFGKNPRHLSDQEIRYISECLMKDSFNLPMAALHLKDLNSTRAWTSYGWRMSENRDRIKKLPGIEHMKYLSKILLFLYLVFLFFTITILSISDYEWMVGEGEIQTLCQIPPGGRYTTEPVLIIILLLCLLFFIKNKKVRYLCISGMILWMNWSFFIRFNLCWWQGNRKTD